MKHNPRTIKGRRSIHSELCDKLNRWLYMSEEELFQEVKKSFPAITSGTEKEFLKYLIANESSKFIGNIK